MNYWNRVLTEILNKHNPLFPTILTNLSQQETKSRQPSHKARNTIRVSNKQKQHGEKTKKYVLGEAFAGVYFTKREAQVALCLIRGNSTRSTAKLLKLSNRTVEFYINNMKSKLNSHLRSDLIGAIMRSDFTQIIDIDLEVLS